MLLCRLTVRQRGRSRNTEKEVVDKGVNDLRLKLGDVMVKWREKRLVGI